MTEDPPNKTTSKKSKILIEVTSESTRDPHWCLEGLMENYQVKVADLRLTAEGLVPPVHYGPLLGTLPGIRRHSATQTILTG